MGRGKKLLLSVVTLAAALTPRAWLAGETSSADPNVHVNAVYRRQIEKFRAEEINDLKKNWLPLAGLFWLKPGANTFGTDPANAIVLPKDLAPAKAGVFELAGEEVTVKLQPGVQGTIEGQPVTSSRLQSDASGKPTVLAIRGLRMHVIKRGKRTGIRLKDLNSPALRAFTALSFYPINPAYRVTATWVASDGKKTVNVPDVLGDVTPTPVAGEARFKLNGKELRLTALGGDPAKGLFFVFSDATSKTETYPAGRFLDTDAVENGTVVLDFNKAYNPPCAVTPYATCPIAPKENRLAVAIPVGEKYERKPGHQ